MSNPADRRCRNQCDSEWLVHDDPECPLFEGAADRPATEPRILLEEALSWALPDEAMPHVDLHVVAGDLIHLLLERDLRLTTMTAAQEDALREVAAEAEAAQGAAPRAEGLLREALRYVEYGASFRMSLGGRPAADVADEIRHTLASRPSDERVPESEEQCKRFRHDEHCNH